MESAMDEVLVEIEDGLVVVGRSVEEADALAPPDHLAAHDVGLPGATNRRP